MRSTAGFQSSKVSRLSKKPCSHCNYPTHLTRAPTSTLYTVSKQTGVRLTKVKKVDGA